MRFCGTDHTVQLLAAAGAIAFAALTAATATAAAKHQQNRKNPNGHHTSPNNTEEGPCYLSSPYCSPSISPSAANTPADHLIPSPHAPSHITHNMRSGNVTPTKSVRARQGPALGLPQVPAAGGPATGCAASTMPRSHEVRLAPMVGYVGLYYVLRIKYILEGYASSCG